MENISIILFNYKNHYIFIKEDMLFLYYFILLIHVILTIVLL